MLVFLMMGAIFFFSAQKGEVSKAQTKEVLSLVKIEKVEKSSGALNEVAVAFRKTLHIIEYSILGIFLSRAVSSHTKNNKRIFWISFVICFLYAISDEIHQIFIPGRQMAVYDILLDTVGAFSGCLILAFFAHKKANKRRIT